MEKETKKIEDNKNNEKIAVIRVRGLTGVGYDIDATLKKMGLYKRNYCIVVPKTKSYAGMAEKAKDYVAWGEIDDETYKALAESRGETYRGRLSDKKGKVHYDKFIDIGARKIKKIFRLNSPKKGYGRKGVKVSFSIGGALGYRGDKINDLIKRMI